MLNTARNTCLVGLVDLYQTELYQDSTDYNELEKSRLLMNFFVTINPCGGEVVTLPGAHCYTLLVFGTWRTYIINAHDLLMNDLTPPLHLSKPMFQFFNNISGVYNIF